MELTADLVADRADAYPSVQPLSAVEAEHLEILPAAFADGDYGWRDAEWVVQWYHRRFLGAFPDATRREREGAYGANDFEAIRGAIAAAADADDSDGGLAALTALEGVDVPVASAFLQFVDPERSLVVGPRTWAVLREAGELTDPYPDPPSAGEYRSYLAICRAVAERCDCTLQELYRALWVLGDERGLGPSGRMS